MGIIRFLTQLTLFLAAMGALTLLLVSGFTFFYPDDPQSDLRVDAIVCLGAGMDLDGTLHPPAIARVEKCGAINAAKRAFLAAAVD